MKLKPSRTLFSQLQYTLSKAFSATIVSVAVVGLPSGLIFILSSTAKNFRMLETADLPLTKPTWLEISLGSIKANLLDYCHNQLVGGDLNAVMSL